MTCKHCKGTGKLKRQRCGKRFTIPCPHCRCRCGAPLVSVCKRWADDMDELTRSVVNGLHRRSNKPVRLSKTAPKETA